MKRVVCIGEVLWDVYPDGARLGGAPANVACHSASLGNEAYVVSAVGTDELGERALADLASRGVHIDTVAVLEDKPTGTVQVELDERGKPSYTITEGVAWDAVPWSDACAELAASADAVVFGSLAQRSELTRTTLLRFLEATPADCLRVFDINLRLDYYSPEILKAALEHANVLKINDEELPLLRELYALTGTDEEAIRQLMAACGIHTVALTLGPKGAIMVNAETACFAPSPDEPVTDTVGAGDSFNAALITGLLCGRDLQTINHHANHVAAFVVTQSGATPALPEKVKQPPQI